MIIGKFIDSKYARLYIRLGNNQFSKIGITASSKIFKKAVLRNKARRLMSAALEPLYGKLPKSINILALPKVTILGVKSGDVLLDLEQVLTNEKIIN